MKQVLALVVGALLVSSYSFADVGLSRNSAQLQALGSAWKAPKATIDPSQDRNEFNMVYGGADISRKPTLAPHSTTA